MQEDVAEMLTPAERKEMINHLLAMHPRPQMFSLPVRRRIRGLKKLQAEFVQNEAQFFKEVHQLECKYETMVFPIMERRKQIINGLVEPSGEEVSHFSGDFTSTVLDVDPKEIKEDVKGVPYFWYTVLRSIPVISDMISKADEPILKTLSDIRTSIKMEPMSFRLEFEFHPNEYFANKILHKNYYLKCEPNPAAPFEFEGSEIYKCEASKIDWKPGKNVTVKAVVKKQRHKLAGDVKSVTKHVQIRSFFNFFNIPKDHNEDGDLDKAHFFDYEIATYLRERVIPKAVLYFTGEAFAEESSCDEDDECASEKEQGIEELSESEEETE